MPSKLRRRRPLREGPASAALACPHGHEPQSWYRLAKIDFNAKCLGRRFASSQRIRKTNSYGPGRCSVWCSRKTITPELPDMILNCSNFREGAKCGSLHNYRIASRSSSSITELQSTCTQLFKAIPNQPHGDFGPRSITSKEPTHASRRRGRGTTL